jgi:hypothetical protein
MKEDLEEDKCCKKVGKSWADFEEDKSCKKCGKGLGCREKYTGTNSTWSIPSCLRAISCSSLLSSWGKRGEN